MKTNRSSHAVFSLGYHIIWCSKYRHNVLIGALGDRLKQVIHEACITYGWDLQEIEVMPDHVCSEPRYETCDQLNPFLVINQSSENAGAGAAPAFGGQRFFFLPPFFLPPLFPRISYHLLSLDIVSVSARRLCSEYDLPVSAGQVLA